MSKYKYIHTLHIETKEDVDLRSELGVKFEEALTELWLNRVEKELNMELSLEVSRVVKDD